VDYHPVVREGLRAVLGLDPDFEVVGEAADGPAAIAAHARMRPDVTVIDLRLPGMDGTEVMAAVRARDPSARFMVLTSYDRPADIERVLAAGALGFLPKSSTSEETKATIRRVHEGGGSLDPEILRRAAAPGAASRLTEREEEVLRQVAAGAGNAEIAERLGIALSTVKFHLDQARVKLGARDRTEAVVIAARQGLLRID
jgi:DNA-binding NarL/FixJ family response regulator